MVRSFFLWISLLLGTSALARRAENLILVTLDEVRWQEVINGANSALLFDLAFSRDTSDARRFSYYGCNEILSGYADDRIKQVPETNAAFTQVRKSNDKIDNPNFTPETYSIS